MAHRQEVRRDAGKHLLVAVGGGAERRDSALNQQEPREPSVGIFMEQKTINIFVLLSSL